MRGKGWEMEVRCEGVGKKGRLKGKDGGKGG
jgi:hypothetical protein